MKVPTVYNMTRYNTDDLVDLVNKAYMFKSLMGSGDNRLSVIQFREHSRKQEVISYDVNRRDNVRMTNYVGYSTGTRRYQVKLLSPELLHDSTVEMLAKGSQAQLALPMPAVKMIFTHILKNCEWFSMHGEVAVAVNQVANRLTVRYDFGKKPKTPAEAIEYDRRAAIMDALRDLDYGRRAVRYSLHRFDRQLQRTSRRVARAKGEFNPVTINRYRALKGELEQLLTDIEKECSE